MVSVAADTTAVPEGATVHRRGGDLANVQYLRAAAAIGVLVFHAADRTGGWFGVGGAGVDVFFVISGFIMWVISARRPPTPGDFLRRRAARIIPLYWLVTLGLAGVWVVAPQLFPHMQATPSHVAMSLLFIPHANPHGVVAPLVAPGWTLNYEMFFYAIFASALLAPARLRLWLLTGVLGALAAAGVVLRPEAPWLAAFTSPLLLEFLAGCWLGKVWVSGRLPGAGVSVGLVAVGVVALGAIGLAGMDVEPARALLWGGPALLIVTGALGLEAAGLAPRWPFVRFLGDASYSVYLVHALAISVALRLAQLAGLSGPVAFAAAVTCGVAAGCLCYLLVERPLLRVFQPSTARGPTASAAATGG